MHRAGLRSTKSIRSGHKDTETGFRRSSTHRIPTLRMKSIFVTMVSMRGKIFFLLALFFLIFSLWPTVYELENIGKVKPEREFELVHNFYTDYNFYLSRIRQGLEGNLTVHEVYTSEPHQGSFIHVMYLAMGWVGAWVRVPWHRTGDIYHMGRIVLAMTLLLSVAAIAQRSFKAFGWQIVGFLLAVTASTYPIFVHMDDGSFRYGGYMPWWSVMDSLQRITFIPHLLAGQALIALILFAASDRETMKKPGNWVFLGILGFILGVVFPPGVLFVDTALFFMILVELVFDFRNVKGKKFLPWIIRHALPLFVFAVISAPSEIYLLLMTSFFPWKQLALADIIRPLPFKYPEYLEAVGPVLPMGVLGIVIAFIRREREMLLHISWVLSWAVLLFVFKFIPQQSPLRFSEMIVHVPLGMLSAYVFYRLSESRWYRIKFRVAKAEALIEKAGGNVLKAFGKSAGTILTSAVIFILPGIWLSSNLFHMYSSYLWQRDFVDHKLRASYPLVPTGSYVMYPLKDFTAAIRWIQDHTTRDTVILSETTAGNYIPVLAGNRVYVGHDNTVRSDEKKMFVNAFFSGSMPPEDAQKWLKEENLHWIFLGPQEWEDAGGFTDIAAKYTFMKQVFKNNFVRIFTVE